MHRLALTAFTIATVIVTVMLVPMTSFAQRGTWHSEQADRAYNWRQLQQQEELRRQQEAERQRQIMEDINRRLELERQQREEAARREHEIQRREREAAERRRQEIERLHREQEFARQRVDEERRRLESSRGQHPAAPAHTGTVSGRRGASDVQIGTVTPQPAQQGSAPTSNPIGQGDPTSQEMNQRQAQDAAAHAELSAADCAELARLIRQLQESLQGNPGDPYLRAALQNYMEAYRVGGCSR